MTKEIRKDLYTQSEYAKKIGVTMLEKTIPVKKEKNARIVAYFPNPSCPKYPVMSRIDKRESTTVEKTFRKEFKTTL